MRFFDPEDSFSQVQRRLPHWAQAGAVSFITWRTHDSVPKAILERWYADRDRWLSLRGIDPSGANWKAQLAQLPAALVAEFHAMHTVGWHDSLDACHGECALRRPELAAIVASSLLHFDGDRYEILDFVIMPNHVHLLATFANEAAMLAQCESWKRFTARQINRQLGQTGRFWQPDAFDHLVRSGEQFAWLRAYIAENPRKARLPAGEYVHYSRSSAK